jgi:hypothetical protein
VTSPSNYEANNDGGGRDGKGKGEDNNAGGNRRVVFHNLKVEGHIVKERPDD